MISARAIFTPRNDLGQFVPVKIVPGVRASVEAACNTIKDAAQGYAPVDTGALRDSITVEIDDSGTTVIGKVGPHVDYAEYVEYGTGQRGDPSAPYAHNENWPGMTAQPYMRPAYDENKPGIVELFKANLGVTLGR